MNHENQIILIALASKLFFFIQAQQANPEFKPNGKAIITVFSDFHTGIGAAGKENRLWTGKGLPGVSIRFQ